MHTLCSWIVIISWCVVVHIMLGRDIRWFDWIVYVHTLCSWIVIISWCIVVHTMLGRDIRWFDWIVYVHTLCCWIIIISWCVVVHDHKLCERVILLHSWICVHTMLGRDVY